MIVVRQFAVLAVVGGILWLSVVSLAQQRGRGRGNESLGQPFRGVSIGGEIEPGVFEIESTGVSTAPVVDAAKDFLASLSAPQREKTTFPVDDLEWRKWDNRHSPPRQGVGFDEMSEQQRDLAFGLMKASLSARGLKLSKDIMKLNGTLAELANNFDEYGEWLYWITIMGEPSETEPWGWQVDGHHLVINYFVLGDQVVMSPVFIGSEPIRATSGKFAGTEVMQAAQDKGLDFVLSLDSDQKAKAVVSSTKPGNNNLGEAYKDNIDLPEEGLLVSELSPEQKELLLVVIEEFIGNMRPEHATVKMREVKEYLDQTRFVWVGGTSDEDVYYYRIQSPVVMIEFDHQRRVAPFRTSEPTRDHIHAVIRTPNGNDYGKDLLRQHLEQHHSTESQKSN
ncbi:hypothetical protein KOR42_12130 [Thalassoglobus neptunius]|uniref:DUF3500 domain-containing protein n=1 Tax=Thalassoglobus neptunius TaxID=1938619 RepID=A0A5C5X4C3_9PLAN|nr:DUF3500 domain-containing protein [Thalassoglobus neptunius]TWT57846.1 hypothetical protein KOR42_12130 [Thalassoglobus neptunius]